MALASDLDNPEFSNPTNPDQFLSVEFYDYAALDKFTYDTTGEKKYFPECPFVRISQPGNKDNIIERPAEGRDSIRWPQQWQRFQMLTGKIANADNVPGWAIEDWDELVPDQKRALKHLRFYTVEQIAGASDAQIQGIGMGGQGLVIKAKRAVAERNGAKVSEAVAERDAKIAELEAKMDRMMALLEAKDEPRKPGRPARQEAAHG